MSEQPDGDPIARAAGAVDAGPDAFPAAVVDDVSLGVLVLAADGGFDVRRVLPETAACESDVVGRSQELRAGGLVRRVERGRYEVTEAGRSALAAVEE